MARLPLNQPYTITNPFGVPDSNAKFGKHSGIDYAVPLNRPVYAPVSGTLTNIVSPTGGNMVVIKSGKYWHRLMHNHSFSRSNGAVSEGQEVGKAGTTGLSTGVHVHWDVNTQGTYPTSFAAFINPSTLKEDEMITSKGQLRRLFLQFTGKEPSQADYDGYINKRTYAYTVDKLSAVRKDLPALLAENARLKAEGTTLTKGKYIVP